MFKHILLPQDFSSLAEEALPHAVTQAERLGGMLILIRVLETFPHVRSMSAADIHSIKQQTSEWARKYPDQLVADIPEKGISAQAATVDGRPNVTILQFAEKNRVDLVVIRSRRRSGFCRWLVGSVADRVVHGVTIPVLLVRTRREETRERATCIHVTSYVRFFDLGQVSFRLGLHACADRRPGHLS